MAAKRVDAIHSSALVVEWRGATGAVMLQCRVPVGRLVRTALARMLRGAILADGDTITVRAEVAALSE